MLSPLSIITRIKRLFCKHKFELAEGSMLCNTSLGIFPVTCFSYRCTKCKEWYQNRRDKKRKIEQ